jgi:hypothetical protein
MNEANPGERGEFTMSKRGRPPLGLGHVDRLPGSDEGRARLRIILATLSGEKTIPEAYAELRVGESRFHELRTEFLTKGIESLEPRPLGRPPDPGPSDLERENLRLHRENEQLKLEVQAAQIREEIALVMPHVLKPRAKKTTDRTSREATEPKSDGSSGTKPSSATTGESTT